jgi:hypothetical protein
MHLDFALRYNILQMYRLDHWSSRAVRAGKGLHIPIQLVYLDEMTTLTSAEITERIYKVKGMYVQLHTCWRRSPSCVSKKLRAQMDTLIRVVSRHEAALLENARELEKDGDRIDLEEIFSKRANANKLSSMLAVKIVQEAIHNGHFTQVEKNEDMLYITATGKRYHTKDCPYCKGKCEERN